MRLLTEAIGGKMASNVNDIKTFSQSGLNTDSDLLAIQGGDSRYRLNVILSEDGNYDILANVQGNVLRSYSLPTGTNIIKGFVEDKENKAGIYFVYNSNDDHCIIRYNSEDMTFTEILVDQPAILPPWADSWMGFADAGIIGNEDEQFLVWADGRELKMINIAYAIAGSYTDPITAEEISFYKKPYTGKLETEYTYDPSTEGNNLKNKTFQFSLRLKYYDNTFSTMSPWSNIPVPVLDTIPSGRLTNEPGNNCIEIDYQVLDSINVVQSFQLLFRVVDIGLGASGSWYIYDEFPHEDNLAHTIIFCNNSSIGIIPDSEAIRLYDYVPQEVNHIGLIDSNRVVTDVGLAGFDNIDLTDPSASTVTVTSEVITFNDGIYQNDSGTLEDGTTQFVDFTFYYPLKEDLFYYFGIFKSSGGTPAASDNTQIYSSYKLTNDYIYAELGDLITSFSQLTISRPSSNVLRLTLDPGGDDHTIKLYLFEATQTYNTLKTGARYKYGFRYGYNGRVGTTQTNEDLIFETNQYDNITGTDYSNYIQKANVNINHDPPADATHFQIVSFGSDIDYYEEYVVYYNDSDITDTSVEYTIYLEDGNTIIRRDDMINRFRAAYNDGIEYGFDFEVGDTIRFLGYFDQSPPGSIDFYDAKSYGELLQYKITSISDTEITLSSSAIQTIDQLTSAVATISGAVLIQIIRFKKNFDSTAEEFSVNMPISEHTGTLDLTPLFADCWKTKQVYINQNNFSDYGITHPFPIMFAWMEKPRISLYYDSYPLSQGRINIVNEFSMARSEAKIRWGGKFIDEAGVNFLTKFDYDDSREIDERNGLITKIQQIGDVLKVYQERKVTSFYLKTTSSTNADGSSTYVFDDAVMSVGRQSIEDYGCTHFSSYIKNVRNAYFFDIINGVVIRDSANGLQPISENLMHSYFKQKARDILEYSGTVNVFGGWDEDLELYMITFIDLSTLGASINETVGFHEPSNKWISFYSFLPEYYGKISGDQLLSFRAGALYEHNVNPVRNNFYGDQYHSEVWLHGTEQAIFNKVFNSIEINSLNQWACPDDDSIKIERPITMQSRLVAGRFRKQEGIYRADFLRDSLNGGLTPTRDNLLNGRHLRGKEITVKLKTSETIKTLLESVIINSTISK